MFMYLFTHYHFEYNINSEYAVVTGLTPKEPKEPTLLMHGFEDKENIQAYILLKILSCKLSSKYFRGKKYESCIK